MKIALIGYGAMGKRIRTLAENKNHEIAVIIDEADAHISAEDLAEKLKDADAAIDFSAAEAVERNVRACLAANVPLVEGMVRSTPPFHKAHSCSARIFRSA